MTIEKMIDAYDRHKNLKIAAMELDISFQTLYWHLKKAGVSVSGDKERYGSEKDRFGAKAERLFAELIPYARDNNKRQFQAKVDFIVGEMLVEVKASKRQCLGVGKGGDRWSFSIKKQLCECDFFVMFAFSPKGDFEKLFLIPAELIASKTTISISVNGSSKWHSYEVSKKDLQSFFMENSGHFTGH